MNLVFPSFCIVVAGAAGYYMEPQLESTLVPQKIVVVKNDDAPAPKQGKLTPAPAPEPAPVPEVAVTPVPEAPPVSPAPVEPPKEASGPTRPPQPTAPATEDLLPPALPGGGDLGGSNTNTGGDAKSDAIVELMKQSIRDGQVTEFNLNQVMAWKAAGTENFDGDTYQIGLAAYKAETIFGVKTLEAKALIKNGKVVKWVWAKSKLEIK